MPVSGGTADKFGNRYEALWAIDQLLRIVDGGAQLLVLEPLDLEESRGVEFTVSIADGTTEYWSVKRQTASETGWSLAALAKKAEQGRSILGDLLEHLERDSKHCAVFASTLSAAHLEELRMYSQSKEMLDARLARSEDLQAKFHAYILPLCGGNMERARTFLLRMRTRAIDEEQLRDRVHFEIRKLFYHPGDSALDVCAVRGHLADLLLTRIHCPIGRESILECLAVHDIRLRDWAMERSVLDQIGDICEAYAAPLRPDLINGRFLPLEGSGSLLDIGTTSTGQNALVVGGAGGGKSATLTHLVDHLRASHVAVIAIRFDQLPDGILTTAELGRKLLLPESPAIVLAGVAAGAPSVIVVDQLDAISIASGRRPEMWSLFDTLRREVAKFPSMSLIVGCREFDLEHDHRMRKLKAEGAGFTPVRLQELSPTQVDTALREAGTSPESVQASLKPILSMPLHLSLFLKLDPVRRIGVHNRDELFGEFWEETERRVTQRLGRKSAWTQVVDKMTGWLSANQKLLVPEYVLDDYREDAKAMASERAVVFVDGAYRFFHESFFDYAFARRFAANAGRLIDLLLSGEQHLFRRAQVRQVLSFLRAHELQRYLEELESVLIHPKVRFHLKSLIFQWMSSLPDPRQEEWALLQRIVRTIPELRDHVRSVVVGQTAWFDVLDKAGFFDVALSSDDPTLKQEAVWMLSFQAILKSRSVRVSELLRKYRTKSDEWDQHLRLVSRSGDVFHSRQMFDLFLSLIDDGTLDGIRPGVAQNDDWWSVLYSTAEERPDLACEAIAHWLDRRLVQWQRIRIEDTNKGAGPWENLREQFDSHGTHAHVVSKAAESPLHYAQQIMPRVADFLIEIGKEPPSRLSMDPLWSFRSFGNDHFRFHDTLLSGLANALEELAKTLPEKLNSLLKPFQDLPYDVIAFLALRAWTAAPDVYADQIAEYLTKDPRRLKIGYQTGTGSFQNYVSVQAVKAAATRCSPENFRLLEQAILSLKDDWEAKHPRIRGIRQLELLEALNSPRVSQQALKKLRELQRKFPTYRYEEPHGAQGGAIGSPIPDDAQTKMSDEQWLRAMQKYTGLDHLSRRPLARSGGEHELGIGIKAETIRNPARFIALAERMSDELPSSYFDAILLGVAECLGAGERAPIQNVSEAQAATLIRRAHRLPNRPCGKLIAWLFAKSDGFEWPDDIVDIVKWYAINDPDPTQCSSNSIEEDSLQPERGSVRLSLNDDFYSQGINSARGAAAEAIGKLLLVRHQLFSRLEQTVHDLAMDKSLAVRSCALLPLLATLNVAPTKAISWFIDCIAIDSLILRAPYVERFVHYAGYRDFSAVLPVFDQMLTSSDPSVVAAASREICLLALDLEPAEAELARIETGSTEMRKAAAYIYARNISHSVVGHLCRKRVKHFFVDPDDSVRAQAALAFHEIADLETMDQADILAAFLNGKPGRTALMTVIHALENSPIQLPDLVCRLAEACVEAYRTEAGDLSKEGAGIGMYVSKIVVRLYAQTEDAVIQSRCLTLIDEMDRSYFLGLPEELRRLDR